MADEYRNKKEYRSVSELREKLEGAYQLDCGHKVTFRHNLGNNIVVINASKKEDMRILCTDCYD